MEVSKNRLSPSLHHSESSQSQLVTHSRVAELRAPMAKVAGNNLKSRESLLSTLAAFAKVFE